MSPIKLFVARYSPQFSWLVVLGAWLGMFALDYESGSLIGMSGFYFSPIGLAIWYLGKIPGYCFAMLAVASRLYVTWFAPPIQKNMITATMEAISIAVVMLVYCYLVSREKNNMAQYKALSETDSLTNSKLRAAFLQQSAIELERAERKGHSVSLIYIDLDEFKAINDNHGHQTGDRLLKEIGATISGSLRVYDIFGRMGGDEFAILLPETGQREASSVAARVGRLVAGLSEKLDLPVSISFGVATANPGSATCIENLLHRADLSMYSAKKRRKKHGGRRQGVCGDVLLTEPWVPPSQAEAEHDTAEMAQNR
ncbi:MAG: GGDEF domain-containing protein [Candidatus Methylumidiphilus sp.]